MANQSFSLYDDNAEDRAIRLRQALVWLLLLSLGAVPVYIAVGLWLDSVAFVIAGIIVAGLDGVILTAIFQTRAGRLRVAALMVAGALIATAAALTLVLPSLNTSMVMFPILTIVLLLHYLSSRVMLALSAVAVLSTVGIFLLGTLVPPLVPPPPPAAAFSLGIFGVFAGSTLTLLLIWQISIRLQVSLIRLRGANQAIERARRSLEEEIATRNTQLQAAHAESAACAEARDRLLDENARQRALIRNVSVPVLPIRADAVVIPLAGALDDERLQLVADRSLHAIAHGAAHVLLDLSGVPAVDTQAAQRLLSILAGAHRLGASVCFAGVSPEAAQTLESLGLDPHARLTYPTLPEGIGAIFRG